jgi:glycolate oxidase subunit GlcD
LHNLIENLRAIVGVDTVLSEPNELIVYECDGLPQHKHPPLAVVFPSTTEQTAEVMRSLADAGVPFTPRGAGTGLSGGALALNRGVVIELARMRKILSIDEGNRTAVVQTGVVNAHVSKAVAHLGLHYVPDPSSQGTCTIGGNLAENAGGIHCLKYGTTTDHVIGARVVLAGGEIVDLGSSERGMTGYDLLGVFVGSEGTFGIATEATLRLVPVPPAVRTLLAEFLEVNDASHAVSAIIAAGVMPAALEMMDGEIIRAVEASIFAAGLSLDIGAALLVELDGIEAGIDDEAERVKSICLEYRARSCRLARDEAERKKLWAARKGAFGAVGRIAPDSMIQDAVVPRSRLPEVLAASYGIASKYDLRLANVFHAGDGNLHPLICFDSRSPDQVRRVKEAGRELMETCVAAGGTITGEHGVGLDKRDFLPLIFSNDDMDTMLRVRAAFDPTRLCNPGKIIPLLRGCGEARILSEPGAVATGSLLSEPGAVATGSLLSEPGAVATGSVPTPESILRRGAASPKNLRVDSPERHSLSARGVGKAAGGGGNSFDPDDASAQLSAIVGATNLSMSPRPPVSPFPRPPVTSSSRPPVHASLLVTPGSIEEASEVMKLASRKDWSVIPAGASTWINAGNPIERVNVIVSTARLNQFLDHEPADLVASAQAGVTLDDFNQTLARGGQWLPLDPPDDGRATLGGVVATGLAGAQRPGYGAPRNFVIGMKVVLADGKLVKAGGRVVKNVAGYDLCKLFTGSYGTLGLIAELIFKLRPLPKRTWTVLVWGAVESLMAGAREIVSANLFPTAVELLSPAFAAEVEFAERNEALLLVRFAGLRQAVEKQILEAEGVLKTCGRSGGPMRKEDFKLWRVVSKLPMKFEERCIWSATVPPSQLSRFLRSVEQAGGNSSGAPRMWQTSVADGRIRAIEPTNDDCDQVAQMLQHLRAEAEALGGSLVVENAHPEIKLKFDAWGTFGTRVGIMQRIKRQLDPQNLLSPGRFRSIE